MKKYTPTILFLQEHWLSKHELDTLEKDFAEYNFLSTASNMFTPEEEIMTKSGPVWHGTSIGWSLDIDKHVKRLPITSERFCGILFSSEECSFLAYTLYLPTSGQDEDFNEVIDILTADILQYMNKDMGLIIGADTNESSKSSKRRQRAMSHFKDIFKLQSIIQSDAPTFHHNNQTSESQIDHILVSIQSNANIEVTLEGHLCKLQQSSNLSSHDVIIGSLFIPETETETNNNINYSDTYKSFKVNKPIWDATNVDKYQQIVNKALVDIFETFPEPKFIPAMSEMCSNALVLSAELAFKTKSSDISHSKKFPKFSPFLTSAYKEHERVCKAWRAAGRPSSNTHPAKLLKLESQRYLQKVIRDEASSTAVKLHNELMECHANDITKVCRKIKGIKSDNRKEIKLIETLCGTFEGENVLEGFCANTEFLCNKENKSEDENQEFLKMCEDDLEVIIELTKDDVEKITHLTLPKLKIIIFKQLKLNKACDIYKLTVEHLRYAGDDNLKLLLRLLNLILDNLSYISSPQLNTSVTSIIHKGKSKPVHHHKSYRQVRVSPLIGRILDEHLRPSKINLTKKQQNDNQYGFTENMSYMLGALQRHEVEKYCVDNKLTFFGCSLDGESAFEVVDRSIQLRELYCAGQTGEYWLSSKYSYENSKSTVKMNGKLSRTFDETLGVKQGNVNSSDDYKIYVNPALDTFDRSQLGVQIGPVNVAVTGVADDLYLLTDSKSKLQSLIGIAEHYGHRYRTKFGAEKTKITVVGPEIDTNYFQETSPWTMNGKTIKVTEDNEHLGQIVSGKNQIIKNIDQSLRNGRKSLYSLLGPAFAFKCLLGPLVKIHLFRTFTCPRLRSGLSSLALRSNQISPLSVFHRKSLKGFLHLSQSAPTPAIHFLFGELPIEGKIHRDMFSLFFSVWCNPDTKIFKLVKYLLETSSLNSNTWAINLQHICKMYDLEHPLTSLNKHPPSKSLYKETIATKISVFHEKELKMAAKNNSKMKFFNVSLLSLRGRNHPSLSNIVTTIDVKKLRLHIKFLVGDYLTNKKPTDAKCKLCELSDETIEHIVASCQAYTEIRERISTEMFNICCKSDENTAKLDYWQHNEDTLTQFILDPTSFNLAFRVNINDPIVSSLFSLSRDMCFAIHNERMRHLKTLNQ